MFTFTPTEQSLNGIKAPYLEDARADFAPYYSSRKTITEAQVQVSIELSKLGGQVFQLTEGVWNIYGQKRYGYEIRFMYGGANGLIRVAGLPIRKETPVKIKQSQVQALLNVCDWLKSAVTAKVFNPGNDPLLAHLLMPDGVTTIRDHLVASGGLPMLKASNQ